MGWKSLGRVQVVTSGTPVRLTSGQTDPTAHIQAHAIAVQHLPGNTGTLVLGSSTMNISTYAGCLGVAPAPISGSTLPSINTGIAFAPNAFNLADYYIDSSQNAQYVLVSYLES